MTTKCLDKALANVQTFTNTSLQTSLLQRGSGALSSQLSLDSSFAGLGDFSGEKRSQRNNYSQYRGWLYSVINALSSEGAGQPARVGRLIESSTDDDRRAIYSSSKSHSEFIQSRMSKSSSRTDIELVTSGDIVDLLQHPSRIQNRWQFTYSFIANLCLTGWSYIITDHTDDGREMYSIPTTWITPKHDNGPFSSFLLSNPKKPGVKAEELSRENVAFAFLPNPSDPLSAIAPASAQAISIRIDDYIQTSQEAFFNNGIFPSVLVTIGKMPLGETGGVRPRLSGSQRRQVHGAIQKAMGGIKNYGNPGILDGLIERIDRLSATQNEMGWEKSEKAIRLRILSSFAVHPFILGEEMAGSYAQAYTVMERFCNRVNIYLDLLGLVLTNFFGEEAQEELGKDNIIWWEPCEPKDPDQVRRWWDSAARLNWVTQNEFRTKLGLPPDKDSNQQFLDRLMAQEVNKLLAQLGQGIISQSQALAFLESIGLPTPLAQRMVDNSGAITPATDPAADEDAVLAN